MNKRNSKLFFFVIIILIALSLYLAIANQSPSILLEVTIEGLEKNDTAELILVSSFSAVDGENTEEILFSSRKLRNGNHRINIPSLPNGPYILVVQAGDYYRDPKGYMIGIENNQIVHREDKKLHFQLVSWSDKNLPVVAESIVDIISPPKQPEPNRPLIIGRMTGVLDDTIITIRVKTLDGDEIQWGKRKGNGQWETVISNARNNNDYFVSAEADGYSCEPVSYSIHIDELKAYVIEDDKITNKEANHLDFHFVSP